MYMSLLMPYITEGSCHLLLCSWSHPKEDRHIEEDRPGNYQIIEVGTRKLYDPKRERERVI